MTIAGSPQATGASTERTVTRLVQVMFPHADFPSGPYERTAKAIVTAADEDLRFKAQLTQGLVDLDVAADGSFADLDDAAAFKLLSGFSEAAFFQGVRARVITTLYDDHEVWELLGYEGPSFDQGGYLNRGFNDLDWLPEPRIDFVRSES